MPQTRKDYSKFYKELIFKEKEISGLVIKETNMASQSDVTEVPILCRLLLTYTVVTHTAM